MEEDDGSGVQNDSMDHEGTVDERAGSQSSRSPNGDDDPFKFLTFTQQSNQREYSGDPLEEIVQNIATTEPEQKSIEVINFETQAHHYENKIMEQSRKIDSLLAENGRILNLEQQIAKLKDELSKKETDMKDVDHIDKNSKKIQQLLEQERNKTTSELLTKQQRIVQLTEDLELSNKQLSAVKLDLREEQNKSASLESTCLLQKSEVDECRQELSQANKRTTRLNDELSLQHEKFSSYHSEKVQQLSRLQSDLEAALDQKNILEIKVHELQSQNGEMQSQLISKLDHIRQLEDDRIVFEQQFRTEMTTQKRLVELCETRTRESTEETDRLKILLEETKSELASVRNDQAVNATEHQNTHKELKDYIEKLELEREKLSSELSMINKEMIDRSQSEQIGQLSQSAAIFDRLKKSGKSFTEMYSDYTRLQHELLKEKSEVARLNDCVSQIVADIDQRAQTMIQINQDYQRAKQINENLSLSLSKVTKEKNDAMEELNSMKDKVASLENEISLLNKDSSDKYRQIQALLREQEVLKGGLDKYEELTESFSDQSGADLIISQRLVTYRNIEELQSQNQTLLRSLRSLSNKMEKQEELLLKQAEEERVTAWTERIAIVTDLQEKLERATRNCESFARERDQWKRVAGNRASDDQHVVEVHRNESTVDYESIYRELQREFDIYRKECGTDTKLMRKQMEELQLERTELKINVAQLNNQIVYLNDRHQLQLQNLETKTRDFEELRKQLQLMNVTANKQDLKIDELNSSLTTCRNTLDTFAAEKQQLEIERQIWKASEARCAAQIQDLQQQRNSSHDRVKELQSFWEEKDKKAGIQLKKLEDQIESLNRELQLSRKQLSDVMDDHRTLLAKRDTLVRETQSKLEKLGIENEKLKGECALHMNKETNATTKLKELTSKLTLLEQKNMSIDHPLTSTTTETSHLRELTAARIEIESIKAELKLSIEEGSTFKAISQASEERLNEMNEAYDVYKEEMEKKIQASNTTIQKLENDCAELREQLSNLRQTLTETQDQLDNQQENFKGERALYELQIEASKKAEEQAVKHVVEMRNDVKMQTKLAQEAQSSYQREVMAHSTSLQTVMNLKKVNEEIKAERELALSEKRSAEEKYNSNKETNDRLREKLVEEIKALEARLTDLAQQNSLLHSQLESLTASEPKETFTEGSEKQHEGDGSKQMAEIITYLRREKEIVQTKLLVVNQENDRLKVSLEQLQRSLDENQLILNQEREKNQSSLVSEDKYKELLSKLEHTHLLRESNITLRAQTESLRAQIAQLENTIAEGELKVGPLEERVSQLTAEVEVRVMECKSLTEDNIRWKGRAQQILEKYERIDPVEHEQLKANLAELLQKNETMSKSFETLQSTLLTTENRIKEKDIQIKEFQRKVEEIEKEKAKVIQSKDAEIELLRNPGSNQELVALQARLTASQQKNRDIVEKANVKLIERNSTIKGLKEEIEKEKSKLSLALESALKEQAAKLSREKERELKQLKTDIQTHWERKLSSLESSLEQQRGVILEQTQMLVSSTEREKEDDQVDLSDNPGTPLGNLAENDESDNSATKRLRESGVEELEGESSFTPAAKRMKTDNIDEKVEITNSSEMLIVEDSTMDDNTSAMDENVDELPGSTLPIEDNTFEDGIGQELTEEEIIDPTPSSNTEKFDEVEDSQEVLQSNIESEQFIPEDTAMDSMSNVVSTDNQPCLTGLDAEMNSNSLGKANSSDNVQQVKDEVQGSTVDSSSLEPSEIKAVSVDLKPIQLLNPGASDQPTTETDNEPLVPTSGSAGIGQEFSKTELQQVLNPSNPEVNIPVAEREASATKVESPKRRIVPLAVDSAARAVPASAKTSNGEAKGLTGSIRHSDTTNKTSVTTSVPGTPVKASITAPVVSTSLKEATTSSMKNTPVKGATTTADKNTPVKTPTKPQVGSTPGKSSVTPSVKGAEVKVTPAPSVTNTPVKAANTPAGKSAPTKASKEAGPSTTLTPSELRQRKLNMLLQEKLKKEQSGTGPKPNATAPDASSPPTRINRPNVRGNRGGRGGPTIRVRSKGGRGGSQS